MKRRARLLISGVVQGVFFRSSAALEAKRFGLVGFARNRMNGDVEVVVEGEERAVQKMIEWCHKGPRMARVDRVAVEWSDPTNRFSSFECS